MNYDVQYALVKGSPSLKPESIWRGITPVLAGYKHLRHSRELGSHKSRTLSKRRKELISAARIRIDAHLVGKARVQPTPPAHAIRHQSAVATIGKVSSRTATPMYYDAISLFKKSNSG